MSEFIPMQTIWTVMTFLNTVMESLVLLNSVFVGRFPTHSFAQPLSTMLCNISLKSTDQRIVPISLICPINDLHLN